MIFFIVYAIGVWTLLYFLRGKWQGPFALLASIVPVALLTLMLLLPSLHTHWRPPIFAGMGGYGRLLSMFTGAYALVIFFVGVVILVTPRRIPAGCCTACAYDLTGTFGAVCPECGSAI